MKSFTIENIAGIRHGSATIEPGLNIVQASNFRGKSSFMASIQTAMGSTGQYKDHLLTEGSDAGSVVLQTDTDSYEVTITRERDNRKVRSGTPYLSDKTDQVCARLFAFLGEDNPIRKAVRNGEDLTQYLQAPLDIEDVDAQIQTVKQKLDAVENQITDAKEAASELPAVQQEVTQLENDLEDLRETRDELQTENLDNQRKDDLSDQLSASKSNLQNVSNKIRQLESQIERKTERKKDRQSKLDELEVPSDSSETVDVEAKQQRITELNDHIQLIEDLYHANRNMLEDGDLDLITDVTRTVSGDDITCWLCGETAMKGELEANIDDLQEPLKQLRTDKNNLENEITEFEQKQRAIKQKSTQKYRLDQEIKQLSADIQDRKGELQGYTAKKETLEKEVKELVDKVEQTESQYNEELTDVKTELRTKEAKLERARERLHKLDEQKDDLEALGERKDEYQDEIESLRNRKTNTQYELKDEFDTAINDIIDRFAPGFDHAHFDIKTDLQGEIEGFELNIARGGQKTTVDALSEGEVELIGVAVALAGYRVYDVDERTPIILIDGISQLASEHLRSLIKYLEDTTETLVTTAYPEAGEFDAHIISPDEWNVVSNREPTSA
jgi:predicted  nucleic acid-binding Zn-ribbon protein